MEGEKHCEVEFERQRSHSVPVISRIEKVPDDCSGSKSVSFERETRTENRRFSETRQPKNTTSRKSVRRLSSGGLMRNQKRRPYAKTAITDRKQTSHHEKQPNLRGFTTGIITNPAPRALTHAQSRRERSKSLPLLRKSYEQDHKYYDGEIWSPAPKEKQSSDSKTYRKMLHQRSMSLPTCLQYEPKPEQSQKHEKESALFSTMRNASTSANFENFVFDLNKLYFDSLKQSDQEKQEMFSEERRRSWPFCWSKSVSNQSMESSGQFSANFDIGLNRQESLLGNSNNIRIQRSKSLPLMGISFFGEVRTEKKTIKDEVSRADNGCSHEASFRCGDVLGEIINRKEHSRAKKKTPIIRSKSWPVVLSIESEAKMSPNLTAKNSLMESLPRYHKLQDAVANRRKARSLPCIYAGSFPKEETLFKVQNIQSKTDETSLHQKENSEESVLVTEKVNGNISLLMPLKRARSLPLNLLEEQQQSGNDHIKNKTKKETFGKHPDFIGREKAKSLPNILEGEHSPSFSPIAMPELLEKDNNISQTDTAEENIYKTVVEVESEEQNTYPSEGNGISTEQDEIGANSEPLGTRADFLKQQEANLDKHQPNLSYPHKLRKRARGFSVPCLFKMEKIIEEPSDIELRSRARGFSIPGSFQMEKILEEPNDSDGSQMQRICGEYEYNEQNDTNSEPKTAEIVENNRLSDKSSIEYDFGAPSCNDNSTVFFHDKSRGKQEGSQQMYDHENYLQRYDEVVSQALAKVNQLEFSKSSSGLHRAAANGDLECVKRLVEKGDDVNGVDESGWPVLHAAITTGNFDCGEWLVEAGADLIHYTNFVIDEYRILTQQVYQNF